MILLITNVTFPFEAFYSVKEPYIKFHGKGAVYLFHNWFNVGLYVEVRCLSL